MKNIKRVAAAAVAAVSVCAVGTAYADDVSVMMNAVVSDRAEYVSFDEVKPMQIEERMLIPARNMAEAAGMEVTWDQPTQTALLTLKADEFSDKPIERFAAETAEEIDGFGEDLIPLSITAALRINDGNAVIRYNFIGDNSEIVSVGKEYAMLSRARLVNDGTLMVPVRDSMEMFGLNVDWNQAEQCAYVSVPSEAYPPDGLSIIEKPGEGRYSAENLPPIEDDISDDGGHTKGAYLGRFKITHYCPCDICNGGWGAYTAWAGELIPGQSVAVNQNIIPKLSWIYIDGYGYRRAEDTGSGIGEYQIDVAVADHETAIRLGVEYKDVYAAQ